MHHHAIIIAGTQREAERVAEAVFHGLITHQDVRAEHHRTSGMYRIHDPLDDRTIIVDYTSAINAVRSLQGLRTDEIIIAGDYMWWFLPRGGMHALWQTIQSAAAKNGAVVSWW